MKYKKRDHPIIAKIRKALLRKKGLQRLLDLLESVISDSRYHNTDGGSSYGTYVLELSWTWNNSHTEFASFGLERCGFQSPPEEILNLGKEDDGRRQLMEALETIRKAYEVGICTNNMASSQVKMTRLYRVVAGHEFGLDRSFQTVLRRREVDIHFVLMPICDFNDKGGPVHCELPEE